MSSIVDEQSECFASETVDRLSLDHRFKIFWRCLVLRYCLPTSSEDVVSADILHLGSLQDRLLKVLSFASWVVLNCLPFPNPSSGRPVLVPVWHCTRHRQQWHQSSGEINAAKKDVVL